jgi:putative Mg2+ transporter-C (MgtC) family protein
LHRRGDDFRRYGHNNAVGNGARFDVIVEVMMTDLEMLIRLGTAAALGSLIGFERERLLWAAGIRTHMLVCVGSCLIMIVSQYGFANVLTQQNVVLDPSRIAAQVVS